MSTGRHKYNVGLSRERTITVLAYSADEARDIAEARVNKTNTVWVANNVDRVDGTEEDTEAF